MTTYTWILIAMLPGYFIFQYADAYESEIGFAKQYVEANDYVSWMFGDRPSLWQIIVANFVALAVLGAWVGFVWRDSTLAFGWSAIVLILASIKHLLAVHKWRTAFDTEGASLMHPASAFSKFLGLA